MQTLTAIASLALLALASTAAAAADPSAPCIQPMARIAFPAATSGTPRGEDAVRVAVASGYSTLYAGGDLTIFASDRATKAATISHVGEKLRITVEAIALRTLPGSRDGFLYDHPGVMCPMDQLPKELQVSP